MNRNQRIVVSIVGIIIVTLALIGITYAYFLTRIIGNSTSTSISGTLANLELTYGDEDGVIKKTNMMPGDEIVKKFTVQNTGTARVDNYAVIFENVTNGLTRKEDLIYTLTCSSDDENPCIGIEDIQFPDDNGPIIFNSINKGTTHSYTLTVTYKNLEDTNQSDDMGANFSAKVNITDGKNASLPIKTMILLNSNASRNGTTYRDTPLTEPAVKPSLDLTRFIDKPLQEYTIALNNDFTISYDDSYIIENDNFIFTNNNKPLYSTVYNSLKGKYIAYMLNSDYTTYEVYEVTNATLSSISVIPHLMVRPSAESTLSKIEDVYGTSYYYRGDVTDNYLTFNNMCWRIVRIQGDGSIKIILEDKTQACGSDIKANNSFIDQGTYGYRVYSRDNIADYLNCSQDSKTCMKNQFDTWFDSNFKNVKDKLKEETWYLGDTTNTHHYEPNYNPNQYNSHDLYEAGRRLHGFGVQKSVSLLEKANPFTSYIAPITADEVALAGATTSEVNGNFTYYLYNDDSLYWTLSLDEKWYSADLAFIVGTNLYNEYIMQSGIGLRPTIVLKADTKVTGEGTKTNPYVVEN